ncbi:MAG: DUF6364 family protein [Chitinophagales bacterium]
MYTKLTLNIDDSSIKKAKRYSRRKKISVSKLVEGYFETLESGARKPATKASIARKLLGCAKGAIPGDMNYKEAMAFMYEERGRK